MKDQRQVMVTSMAMGTVGNGCPRRHQRIYSSAPCLGLHLHCKFGSDQRFALIGQDLSN